MNIITLLTRLLHPGLAALLFAPAALTGTPPRADTESSEGQWVFSLLPRSLQKNPLVDLTVMTEMTDEGRKLPPPTPDRPVYYTVAPMGYHAEGHAPDDRNPPAAKELIADLQRALAVNGYRPAAPGLPPSLLIVFHWGLHSNLDAGDDQFGGFPDVAHRNLLSRAALVGGSKFAAELRQALEKQDLEDLVKTTLPAMFQSMLPDFGPLRLFVERDAKTRQLYESARTDCYYAIASAYDYAEASSGRRKLLWRSKLTVDASGVAMRDTLPGLILSAGKYLGVDMPEAATITQHMERKTTVTLGPLEVDEYLEPAPAKPKD